MFYVPVPVVSVPAGGVVHRPADSAGPRSANVPSGGIVEPFSQLNFVVRLVDPERLGHVLDAVRGIDSRIGVQAAWLEDIYAQRHGETRMAMSIVSAFAGFALIVAVTGIYGVMAFLVATRRREIGIRMALGAAGRDISRLIISSSAKLVAAGVVIGSATALAASRWIASQLFGVSPSDVSTYAMASAAIAATAFAATWLPARQAARVDPAVALRTE